MEKSDNCFDWLCRTCMQELAEMTPYKTSNVSEKQWRSLSDTISECNDLSIAELLISTVPKIHVHITDKFSKKICHECFEQLKSAYGFQKMCLQSERVMDELFIKEDLHLEITTISNSIIEDELSLHNINSKTREIIQPIVIADPLQRFNEDNFSDSIKSEPLDEGQHLSVDYSEDEEVGSPISVKKDEIAVSTEEVNLPSEGKKLKLESCTNTCYICNKSFKNAANFKTHLKRHKRLARKHPRKQNKEKKEDSEKRQKKVNHSHFKCDICDCYFHRAYSLEIHRQKHFEKRDNISTLTCEPCKKAYNSRTALAKHKRERHPGEKLPKKIPVLTCEFCNDTKMFKSLHALTKHKREQHSEEKTVPKAKTFTCEICNKSYSRALALEDHLRRHTGEQAYICPECGKSFSSAGNLSNHLLRHSEDRPFECPYCPSKFRCPSDLYRHKVTHEQIKPHICEICGYKTAEPYQLKVHKKKHTGERPYKCDHCEMRFARLNQQRCHMLTHTGERPYKCKYCERAFTQSYDHVKHLRIHLGEKVYRCKLCPLAFRLASEVRMHYATHKNDDEETRERNLAALREEEDNLLKKFGVKQNKQHETEKAENVKE